MEILFTMDLPAKLAEFNYHLVFPKKDFTTLPDSVKMSYISDAEKILQWLRDRAQ